MEKNKAMEGGDKMGLSTLYDYKTVAARYHVHEGTVRKWVMKKTIPFIKIGKNVLFSEKDLYNWEKESKVYPQSNNREQKRTEDIL